MEALEQIDAWPAETAAVAVVAPDGAVAQRGPDELVLRWASVTKLFAAYAVLVAAEEGVLDLEEPAGPPSSTVRHLLAHASGLPFEGGEPMGRPGERRIYSNIGFELRDAKQPHWTGARNSPRTFGHFGGAGTFLWVDPDARCALACLTNLEFDEWALAAWPRLADAILDEYGGSR